tara:strand:- start:415 stop:573 length:159 start_codon:yes stop_codon:yes gene_type:complete
MACPVFRKMSKALNFLFWKGKAKNTHNPYIAGAQSAFFNKGSCEPVLINDGS